MQCIDMHSYEHTDMNKQTYKHWGTEAHPWT